MSKKAFTLIELLVVIAIIAILASILFPVFTQAKAAAKKAASVSNAKQVAYSALMYAESADDRMVVLAGWGAPGVNDGAWVSFGGRGYHPWTELVQPYAKNLDIFQDPQAPLQPTPPAGANSQAGKLYGPNYGMNPYLGQNTTYPYATDILLHDTRVMTAISRPADMVMFAQKYSNSETTDNSWYGGDSYGVGGYLVTLSVDPPDCYAPHNLYFCRSGWGDNGFYGGHAGQKWLKNSTAAGAYTGGASLRSGGQMIVAFADGHVASRTPGAMAEGTTYRGTMGSDGIPTQNMYQVSITDITREHWLGVQ